MVWVEATDIKSIIKYLKYKIRDHHTQLPSLCGQRRKKHTRNLIQHKANKISIIDTNRGLKFIVQTDSAITIAKVQENYTENFSFNSPEKR